MAGGVAMWWRVCIVGSVVLFVGLESGECRCRWGAGAGTIGADGRWGAIPLYHVELA